MPKWTPTTLSAQLMGELNLARNAAGGAVPDRLDNIIDAAYEDLWMMYEWIFRQRIYDLAVSSETTELPADFEKLETRWLLENSKLGNIQFAQSPAIFETYRHRYTGTTSTPYIGVIEPTDDSVEEDGSGAFVNRLRLAPPPSGSFEYRMVYLCTPPTLASDGVPLWPYAFFTGWQLRAKYKALSAFFTTDKWVGARNQFLAWKKQAIEKNDETIVNSTPLIEDGYGDAVNLTSSLSPCLGRNRLPDV